VASVRARIRVLLHENDAAALVSSAASGADLIALSEAGKLGLRRRVILPFARAHFRETSVIDRPGDWGALYDQIIDAVEKPGDLVELKNLTDDEAYSAANHAILDEAARLAEQAAEAVLAVRVWDGVSRGANDLTEAFGDEARKRGLSIQEIRTI
jgi:hypothetical protein